MFYFKSKYLSERLDINSAKWKRWTREFLQPDPLGGYQSGYARQFSCKDAFRVFLAGHLVGEQRFSIPEARQILSDLNAWLKKQGFYSPPATNRQGPCPERYLLISKMENGRLTYTIRTIVERSAGNVDGINEERYELQLFGTTHDCLAAPESMNVRIVLIDALHRNFVSRIRM